jgi:hypothetical protein
MLARSPPLPLVIDRLDEDHDISAEDEEGIILALRHRDRVCRIRLIGPIPIPILQKLINGLDGEFPILEYLNIKPRRYLRPMGSTSLNLPQNVRAPHLRQVLLRNFAIPIGSSLLTTMRNAMFNPSLCLLPPECLTSDKFHLCLSSRYCTRDHI